jgi:hypothetical protein
MEGSGEEETSVARSFSKTFKGKFCHILAFCFAYLSPSFRPTATSETVTAAILAEVNPISLFSFRKSTSPLI